MLMSTAMQVLFTILHRNASWLLVKELKDVISEIPWRYVDKRLCERMRQEICYHNPSCLKEFPIIWFVDLLLNAKDHGQKFSDEISSAIDT